jgi:hypothetical protein
MSREERQRHEARINKYYTMGTYHAQSAAGTIYILATVLERVDNDLLWYVSLCTQPSCPNLLLQVRNTRSHLPIYPFSNIPRDIRKLSLRLL